MNSIDVRIAALIHNLVLSSGRDPAGFEATSIAGGGIQIKSGSAVAVYPVDGWTTKFSRHLHAGYFDQVVAPSQA